MIHPDDLEFLEKVFRSEEVPDEVLSEYDVVRSLADCYGISGPLGRSLMIPMLRGLGIGRVKKKEVENVDWRNNIGEDVIAQYGDRKVAGKVVSLGAGGRLVVLLDGYGEVELPRYCVSLNKTELVTEKVDDWAQVEVGTEVVVDTGDEELKGKFVSTGKAGVKVRVGSQQRVFPHDEVRVANESEADV